MPRFEFHVRTAQSLGYLCPSGMYSVFQLQSLLQLSSTIRFVVGTMSDHSAFLQALLGCRQHPQVDYDCSGRPAIGAAGGKNRSSS
jgi:hypothetical protein